MRVIRNLLSLGALALVLAAFPAAATAKPGYIRVPGVFYFSLDLGRIDGYALRAGGGRRGAYLAARRGGTEATYVARGFANRHRLEVDLGRFGWISVRLERSPRVTHDQFFGEQCKGRPPRQLRGVASGRIRFRGLADFVSLDKRRAKAEVVRSFDLVCKREPGTFYVVVRGTKEGRHRAGPGRGFQLRANTLDVRRRSGGESIELTASNLSVAGSPASGSVSVSTSQRLDGVEILNSASASADRKSLSITRPGVHPAAAKVRGTGPFSGEGSYRQLAGGRSEWNGSLAVELPGEGVVPLSGPGFHAQLCHGGLRRAFGGCRQSSGSHSQSLFDARLSWSR